MNDIDFSGKVISQMPCNNGRELLSLMKFGAKKTIGFDISDTAVSEAERIAKIAKLNVAFERSAVPYSPTAKTLREPIATVRSI